MFVYIVECSDKMKSYYTGVTSNYIERVEQHNAGVNKDCYTYSRRPVTLKKVFEFDEPLQAIQFEKRIKGRSRKKKEALIRGDIDEIIRLSNKKRDKN